MFATMPGRTDIPAATIQPRVRDIYVGADGFLLVSGPAWKRGRNQMGIH
jgi:hypothetical protein